MGGDFSTWESLNTIQQQLCGAFLPSFYEIVSEIIPCVPHFIIRDQQGLGNFPAVQKYNPSKVNYSGQLR